MLFHRILKGILFSFLIIFASCNDDDNPISPNPTDGLIKISEAYATGAKMKVQLWSKNDLFVGYNNLFIAVLDSVKETYVTDAHIHLEPMMDMGMMQHSSPYENPSSTLAENNLFPCSAVFLMPSSGGSWMLNVEVHNHTTNIEGMASLPIIVNNITPSVMKSTIALNDSSKLFISYLKPTKLNVGINDFEITIHKRSSMMEFPAVTNYSIVITPEMPSMGHGSPNNVNPVHSANGHYKGKVNFTMTGDWRINLDIYKNDAVVDTTLFFDVTL